MSKEWTWGQIILGANRTEEYSNTIGGGGIGNNSTLFIPNIHVHNANKNLDGGSTDGAHVGDPSSGASGGGDIGSSTVRPVEYTLGMEKRVKIPGQMVPVGQVGEDHIANIIHTYKRVFFRFIKNGKIYHMNMFFSTLSNVEHYSLSELSIAGRCPGKYSLGSMFPNDPSSIIAPTELSSKVHKSSKFANISKNNGESSSNNNNNNNGSIVGTRVRAQEPKLVNPRKCNTDQQVGDATCMTSSAKQLWEYICNKCTSPSQRGYYDCGNNFLVHVLATANVDLFHVRDDSSTVPAKGNCAVIIDGQRGDHNTTTSKCYINGIDERIYHAFIPKTGEGTIYKTNATIAPDWESIHGPHLGERFYDNADNTAEGKFYRVPIGSSFFVYMCYNFMALLKEYVAKNENSCPEAITTDMYNELLEVSKSWPDIDIYAGCNLIDDRAFQIVLILEKTTSVYLWKCESYSFNFCVPVKWADLCSAAFQRSSTSLHCLMPSKMAIELAYQKGFDRDNENDVHISGVIKAQAFIPFYCFYTMPEQEQM
jgi:hypothetical protein